MIRRIKKFDNTEEVQSIGIIVEGANQGQPSYVLDETIKEVFENEVWIPNPGFNLVNVKEIQLKILETKLLKSSIKKSEYDRLKILGEVSSTLDVELEGQITDIQNGMTLLNAL